MKVDGSEGGRGEERGKKVDRRRRREGWKERGRG